MLKESRLGRQVERVEGSRLGRQGEGVEGR